MKSELVTIVHVPNPFDNTKREIKSHMPGVELLTLVPKTDAAMICIINGEPVCRENWDCTLEAGDIVIFKNLPAGGGNSNVLQTILAIVLIVVGVVIYAYGGDGSYFIAAGVGLLAVQFIPTPKVPLAPQAIASPSPTYDVALGGNSARLNQPIPVPYGRQLVFPDFAAQPYIEYIDNDSYYHALLCLGHTPNIDIESISIDDTAIASFQDVQYQVQGLRYSPLQTLVSPAVVNAPEVADAALESFRVVGPFACVGPGLTTQRIGIDINLPKGLYYANDSGALDSLSISWRVDVRTINNQGFPTGDWVTVGTESLSANTNTPQRRSYTYTVPRARYEVRMSRTDERNNNSRAGHDINWIGLRSYVDTVAPLEPNATYLAIRIRATSQLSGSSQRKIAVVLNRLLRHWAPGTGWGPLQRSRSIAWALADVLKDPVYGRGLSDSRIDLQSLYELDQVWRSRGDTFNAVFDQRKTIWQALSDIARTGRARPLLRSGVFTFVRDSRQELPVAMFNMRNIKRGSFSIDYATITEDSADAVELEFFNELTWSVDSITINYPGVTTPINVSKGNIFGVTNRQQAIRETAYTVGAEAYRRSLIRFTTEMEGFLPTYGDLIAVCHDVPNWGLTAELESIDLPSVTISEDVPWTASQFYAFISDVEGDVQGPYRVRQGSGEREVIFMDVPSGEYYTGSEKEQSRIAIGEGIEFLKYCRVTSITPKAEGEIDIVAIVEDNRVHEQDTLYLVQFPEPRPAYVMADTAPNYNDATLAQKSGIGGWATRPDNTVGNNGDAGYVYQ